MQSQRNRESLRVAIIGAGFSGLAAAKELRGQGFEDITIFEKSPELGGTWWANRYPGAEVDLESHIYSFSWARHDWTRTHASWRELLGYLRDAARNEDLERHLRLGVTVSELRWDEDSSTWEAYLEGGSRPERFEVVISAVGYLNVPVIPAFASGHKAAAFDGTICHTSTWPENLDVRGKRVAVVGTGSSAAQVIPAMADQGADVVVFQKTPNWVLPKNARAFSPWQRRLLRIPLVYRVRRSWLYFQYDRLQYNANNARAGTKVNVQRASKARANLRRSFQDLPDLERALTPEFAPEGRRTIISDEFYPAFRLPNVSLLTRGAAEVTTSGLVDTEGQEHPIDIIVLATGFDAANYLGTFRVAGRGGDELHKVWDGEPRAYLGMMVPDFPNLFMMYGPNTNVSPLVCMYEAQGRFIAKTITDLRSKGARSVQVRRSAFEASDAWIQDRLTNTLWAKTASYYRGTSGRVLSQWPSNVSSYIWRTTFRRRSALEFDQEYS